jgi:putative transposase
MVKDNVVELRGRQAGGDLFTELPRASAQRLICQAVEAELEELLAEHAERRTADGKAGVVRDGYVPEREPQAGFGPVTVRIPKVRARTRAPDQDRKIDD